MTTGEIIIAALFAIVVVVIASVYLRRGRVLGAAGWILLLGGQVFLALGGGESFAWGGLAALFVSASGLLMIVLEIVILRRARR